MDRQDSVFGEVLAFSLVFSRLLCDTEREHNILSSLDIFDFVQQLLGVIYDVV